MSTHVNQERTCKVLAERATPDKKWAHNLFLRNEMKGLCGYLRSVFSNPRGILVDVFFFFVPPPPSPLRICV